MADIHEKKDKNFVIAETDDYERLVPFFVENDLEFPEEDDIETPTDLVQCWKVTEREEPDETSEKYASEKEQAHRRIRTCEKTGGVYSRWDRCRSGVQEVSYRKSPS